jgi:hypothetical protein
MGVGAVEQVSGYRKAWTWYAEASPVKQHAVMLVVASLLVMVLIAILVAL